MKRRTYSRQNGVSLVELLVGMVILTIVTAAIIMVWFVLQDSFSYSTKSSEQREAARDGVTLLARELRDVQPLAINSGTPPILTAGPYRISFYTTFHDADAESPGAQAVKVVYTIEADGDRDALYRTIGDGEKRLVVADVMNQQDERPLFQYSYFNAWGQLSTTSELDATMTDRIQNIQIQLIIDVNPGHTPTEMRLTTTVQPRNLRST
jgi:prepilin-type N-terminal cleavage/methylation domain-containing protein